jgi:dipeptidyl aminopeptidase/acylaminoacyl peptidase
VHDLARSFRSAGTFLAFVLIWIFAVGTADRAYAAKKVALVIGNSAYQKASALPNPKNDAAAVGALLKSAGFAVVVIRNDLDQKAFTRVLRDFTEHARNADMAVIFYAGHGIEVGGSNYLIPTDATIERDIDVQDETISLERLSSTIEKAKRLRLIILDACRDNPFAEKMRNVVATRSFVSRGLAKVEPPADTLIAFAAKAGSVAADGSEGNSPFTKALLKHLVTPGLDIRLALGKIRDEVFETTNEKQEPFVYGSLGGATVALVDPPKTEPPVKQAEPVLPPSPQRPVESLAVEAARAWPLIADSKNCRHLEAFIKRFDTTFHADLARDRLEELNNCKRIATPAPQPSPKPQPAPPPQRAEEPQPQKQPEKKPGPIASVEPQPKPDQPKELAPSIPALCRPDRQISVGPAVGGPLLQVRVQPNLSAAKEFRAIAFSRDGTRFATAGDDRIVRLWDATSFQMIRELRGHGAEVYSVDFSADSKVLASTGFDGTVRLWDVRSGESLHVFRTESARGAVRQFGVAFYPGSDSGYVDSVGADGQVWIWDVQHKRLNRKRASHADSSDTVIRSISFSPKADGEFLAGGFDGTIRQFLNNGKVQSLKAHTGKVLQVAYAPGGDRFATAGVDTASTLKVWTLDRRLIRSLDGHKGYVVSVAWSKDGRLLASGGGAVDRTVRVWDTQTGRQLHLFTGHAADIEGVAFHPNGKWVLSVSEDKTVKVWSLGNGREILTLAAFEGGDYVAYAPNGCHTGSGEAQRFIRLVSKDEKGAEHNVPDNARKALFLPADALPALLAH